MMKYMITIISMLTVTAAFSSVSGFLTQESRSWDFIQAVGGMKVQVQDDSLHVDCNVSGLKQVTQKPTLINSGIGVRKLKHKRDGNVIFLTVVTSVIKKGMKTSPEPIDLSNYPAGEYSVQYLDPDGAKHVIGKITVKRQKKGQ